MRRIIVLAVSGLALAATAAGQPAQDPSAGAGQNRRAGETEAQCVERIYGENMTRVWHAYRDGKLTDGVWCLHICAQCVKLARGKGCRDHCRQFPPERQ
jgi:hypothetical protein